MRQIIFGPPRDPMAPETHRHISMIALLAWVGLGANGLSSTAYGPELAFIALGQHTELALFLALAVVMTVFVIAISYNQVIELFPTGGGGYKVATRLLGKSPGLVSGSALVVDYVLTIAISIAAGVDAVFSFLPLSWGFLKIEVAAFALLFLMILNLRGVKDSIKVLLPVFVGFVTTHAFLIIYGVGRHAKNIGTLFPDSIAEAQSLSAETGILFVIALFVRAYGLSGGTYTGIEAVSNNIHMLKEPRERTGKLTMLYMAISLSFTAGGIMLLYLLWGAQPVAGQTLNAVVFGNILADWPMWGGVSTGDMLLVVTMASAAGLLFLAANDGFLGGPSVLANMAVDHWVPHRFSQLSDRLVTKNGILLMGGAAFAVLLFSQGRVEYLVILYSVNVFLTFSLTLLGLCVYYVKNRKSVDGWMPRLGLTMWGLLATSGILVITLKEKFFEGGMVAAIVTATLASLCVLVRWHYRQVRKRLIALDEILTQIPVTTTGKATPPIREGEPAAVFFVSSYRGVGIHTLLNSQRLFPGRFQNFVFLSVGEVDITLMKGDHTVVDLRHHVDESLRKYVEFCHAHNMAAVGYSAYGTDPVEAAVKLADQVLERFPGSVFFAGTLVFREENWLTRLLHNHTALALQRQLHIKGMPLVIMPMQVDTR
ncbi:MAG: APC family permease [Gammaproteobacteria bacterium]|nr:APC family permease [Gammaproteobacteria bacterium]MDH5486423.1 APC family permease [Gammaproteobacteria bacterium]